MNSIIPLFFIPTTGKSEYIYDKIIKNVISIYEDTDHSINGFPKYFMMDFEGAMQKAIKNNFNNIKIDGCFFHFVKLLWGKAKKLKLCNFDKIRNTKILVFILKIIPFMKIEERVDFFEKIKKY